MRNYSREQQWRAEHNGAAITGLMPGAAPGHIVHWGPGVLVSIRGVAYAGDGTPGDHGRQPHKLHKAGRP